MKIRALSATATAVVIVIALLAPTATAAEPPAAEPPAAPTTEQPTPPPAEDGLPAGLAAARDALARQADGPPGQVRELQRVLPGLRHMPIGTTTRRIAPGNGEACPGVPIEGPRYQAFAQRLFDVSDTEQLYVQIVAFDRPRQAQRALETAFGLRMRECRRFVIDDLTFESRRTRPPFVRLGDARVAFRTRITYDDPAFGPLHAAELATTYYRTGRYIVVAQSSGYLAFLGDTPSPNYQRWADAITFMLDRAVDLPR